MDLQTAFYTLGIVFMSIMLIIVIALMAAVFTIKAKINSIHQQIEDKLRTVSTVAHMGEAIVDTVRKVTEKRR